MTVLIVIAFIGLLFVIASKIRATNDPDKSTRSLNRHDIHGGYLLGKMQKAAYNAQADAVDAKIRAKTSLIALQTSETAVERGRIQDEILLKQAEFDKEMAPLRLLWKHQEEDITHQVLMAVGEEAKNRKLSPANYEVLALTEGQAMAEVKKEKGLSEIRVDEHEKMKRIDVDAALMEQLNTISAILQYKNIKYNELDEMRNRIFTLIDEEDRIENSNASALVKGQKLALIEGDKQFYQEVLHALKGRLLETGDGEEISGVEAFTSHLGGLGADSESGAKDPIPLITSRSRGEYGSDEGGTT